MTRINDNKANIRQRRHTIQTLLNIFNHLPIQETIETLFQQLEEKTSKTKTALYRELKISQAHFDRVKANPTKYAGRAAKLKNKIKELLEAHEAAKKNQLLNPPLTSYGDKTYNTNVNSSGNLNQKLNRLDILEDVVHAQNKTLIEQNKALLEYIASDGTEEDKKVLRSRIEQANIILQSSTTNTQEPIIPKFVTPKARKRKPKQGNDQQEPKG